MRFSLIVATFGRHAELQALLESFVAQSHQDFEVIVVDQNAPDYLKDLRERFAVLLDHLVWQAVDFKAANLARNLGLAMATGDVVTFADDDCEYRPETLATVAQLFERSPACAVLTGKSVDKATGCDSMSVWPDRSQRLGLSNILNLSLEFTTFYRRRALAEERLDPIFGPGTRFASREGPDLMLRLLYRGLEMHYEPSLAIFHPDKFTSIADPAFIRRTKSYELGFGALLAKHLTMRRSLAAIAMLFYRVFIEGLLALLKNLILFRFGKMRFWTMLLRHRAMGFAEYRADHRP
jgi:glycosyltransferase involved in cell wall biosynthesis